MRNVLSQENVCGEMVAWEMVEGWLNTITVENVHPNTTVALRMKESLGKRGCSEAVCI
ncbi:MAG: hypothetical protein ACLS61_21855 [Ruminococcus sp.]